MGRVMGGFPRFRWGVEPGLGIVGQDCGYISEFGSEGGGMRGWWTRAP